MSLRIVNSVTALLALIVSLSACTSAPPAISPDGLTLVPKSSFGQVYAKQGVDITGYDKFVLADCDVAFRKNWLRDQNQLRRMASDRVTADDMNEIRTSLAGLCTEQFGAMLAAAPAYTVVDQGAVSHGTLLLQPHIIDLDISAPDTQDLGRARTYTTESGEMTLLLNVKDAVTGETLYRVVDRRRANATMQMQWTNRVTNMADAKRILTNWSQRLREGLDQVMAR